MDWYGFVIGNGAERDLVCNRKRKVLYHIVSSLSQGRLHRGNGSSCFQPELGGDKKSPPTFLILHRLNSKRKEII